MSSSRTQPLVRCYGTAVGLVEAALQKVAALGVLGDSPIMLVVDDGNVEHLHAAFSGVLSDLGRITGKARLCRCCWAGKGTGLFEIECVTVLKTRPLDLQELNAVTPVTVTSDVVSRVSDSVAYLAGLADQYRTNRATHGKAVGKLWGDTRRAPLRKGVFPLRVVLVDDDNDFLKKARERLQESSDVQTYPSLKAYLGSESPPESVDLFLLDIVSEDKEDFSLAGMERALPILNRARGLKHLPMIFMLSTLPRKMVAHLCLAMGADYYMEKREFEADPDPCRTLWDLMVQVANAKDALVAVSRSDSWDQWKGWQTLAAAADDPDKKEALLTDQVLLWQLFSRSLEVTKIDLIKQFGDGKSGARVLAVNVWTADYSRPIAPRIVKFDAAAKLVQEWTAFHKHVAAVMTGSFGRVEPCYARLDKFDRAALSMTIAGSASDFSMDRIIGCNQIVENNAACAADLPRRIFSDLLLPLHGIDCDVDRGAPNQMSSILDFMASELLPVEAASFGAGDKTDIEIVKVETDAERTVLREVCFQRVKDGKLQFPVFRFRVPDKLDLGTVWHVRPGTRCKLAMAEGCGELIVNPSDAITHNVEAHKERYAKDDSETAQRERANLEHWSPVIVALAERVKGSLDGAIVKFVQQLATRSTPWVRHAVVHGDLNLKNVLGSETADGLWLIDFANTRPGPPALDFVTFEAELRLQEIVRRIGSRFEGDCASPTDWLDKVWQCASCFETLVQDDERVDLDAMQKHIPETDSNIDSKIIRRAWQGILGTREQAFRLHYPGTEGRQVYDTVFALFLLRVLQKYKEELFSQHGPVGTVWAAAAMQVCLNRAPDSKGKA